jgi:hypothetical protein
VVVYPGAGHAFHWEEPARFAADLMAFTDKLGRPARGTQLLGRFAGARPATG